MSWSPKIFGQNNNEPLGDFRDVPLHFFQTVDQVVEQGRLVNAGDFIEFVASGFLGCTHLRAIA